MPSWRLLHRKHDRGAPTIASTRPHGAAPHSIRKILLPFDGGKHLGGDHGRCGCARLAQGWTVETVPAAITQGWPTVSDAREPSLKSPDGDKQPIGQIAQPNCTPMDGAARPPTHIIFGPDNAHLKDQFCRRAKPYCQCKGTVGPAATCTP